MALVKCFICKCPPHLTNDLIFHTYTPPSRHSFTPQTHTCLQTSACTGCALRDEPRVRQALHLEEIRRPNLPLPAARPGKPGAAASNSAAVTARGRLAQRISENPAYAACVGGRRDPSAPGMSGGPARPRRMGHQHAAWPPACGTGRRHAAWASGMRHGPLAAHGHLCNWTATVPVTGLQQCLQLDCNSACSWTAAVPVTELQQCL
eukprot:352563-Chlamydomonas_euryale.AAC.1